MEGDSDEQAVLADLRHVLLLCLWLVVLLLMVPHVYGIGARI